MTNLGHGSYHAALQAACERAGIDCRDPVVLHVRANAVYHLPRDGVVARIRLAPAGQDKIAGRLAASVRVTRWLCDQGFPAVEPLAIDQPVTVPGHVATFWRHTEVSAQPGRDTANLGLLLRRLHSLPPPPFPLPEASLLGSLRADLTGGDAVPGREREWLLAAADELEQDYCQARSDLGSGLVHGDAHAGNLLHAPGGVLLGDWDSVGYGPRELDLTPTSMWFRFGRPEAEWRSFCAAYGADPARSHLVPVLRRLREMHALAAYIRNASDPAAGAELSRRIASLVTGDQAAVWRVL